LKEILVRLDAAGIPEDFLLDRNRRAPQERVVRSMPRLRVFPWELRFCSRTADPSTSLRFAQD